MLQGDGKTLTYNAFNMPVTVSRNGTSSTFSYGADLQRYKQVLSNLSGTATTHYIDKAAEVEIKGNSTTTRVYIDDIAILSKTQLAGQSNASYAIRYTLRDRLGSVVSLTNEANVLNEHRSYDPFGKPRKGDYRQVSPATLAGIISGTPFTQRGFTDHEHLDAAQLIHMNGRVYDYNLGRFLSVDPIIQSPGNSQSLNPYSYIMNNPLAGTDPTGYTSCDADSPKECADVASTLDEGEVANITQSETGSRIKRKIGTITGNGNKTVKVNIGKNSAVVDIGAQKEQAKPNISTNQSQNAEVDFNNDPVPQEMSARRSTLPVELTNDKLNGTVNWSCSGTSTECTSAITYMNEVTKSNSDILNVTHQLAEGKSDASIRFTNGYAVKDTTALGAWIEGKNQMVISRMHNSPAFERVVKHELGHAYGLSHSGNHTKNFMSYHNMGMRNISKANNYPYKLNSLSKSLIRHYNKPEPKGWSLF